MVTRHSEPDLLRGALAGLAAGLVASAAMHAFQTIATRLSAGDESDNDPATVKAADAVVHGATGKHIPEDRKAVTGNLVHYGTGTLIGVAYGMLAEYQPEVTKGMGVMLGSATALLLDEGAVPALGLGAWPTETPASTHLFGAASHAVYGFAAEATRAAVSGALAA